MDDPTAQATEPGASAGQLWRFVAVLGLLATTGLGWAVWRSLTGAGLGPPGTWVLVVLLVLACGALEVSLPLGDRTLAFDLAETGLVVALVLLPPPSAVIAVTVAMLTVNLLRRHAVQQVAFNVAVTAVAATTAAMIAGVDGPTPLSVTDPADLLILVVAVVIYGLVNTFAAALLLVRLDGTTFALTIRGIVRGTSVSVALSGSLGVIAVVLLEAAPLAMPALFLPAWIAYRALVERVERIRGEVAMHDRLERTVEGASDGIALLDAEGTVELANPALCVRLGVPRDRLVGTHLVDQLMVEAADDAWPLRELLDTLDPQDPSGEVDLHLGDAVYTLSLTGLFDLLGARSGTVVLLLDVTEQRETESLRQEFVARVSHELRTPLTSIIGFIATLRQRHHQLPDEERERYLLVVERQAARLERLVSTLLWSARLERDRALPSPRSVPLEEAVQQTTEVLADLLPSDVEVNVGTATVHVDPDHLQQVLGNLLANAATYGRPPIVVRAWCDDAHHVTIEVSDGGPGVMSAFVPELFSPFAQASTGDRRTSMGLGLGLSITRGLLEVNDGDITYTREDGRTCFRVSLPAGPAGAVGPAGTVGPAGAVGPAGGAAADG